MLDSRLTMILAATFAGGFVVAKMLPETDETAPQPIVVEDDRPNPFATVSDDRQSALEQRLQTLEQRVILLDQRIAALNESMQQQDAPAPAGRQQIPAQAGINRPARVGLTMYQRLLNVDSLVKGGVSPAIAEDLVSRKNQLELRKLELQNKAIREGYMNSARYLDELAVIEAEDINLREELGDDTYDRYLFDNKQHNRVRVTRVIPGSEADKAGIIDNDIIYSYDDRRIFEWGELTNATSKGLPGEYVNIVVDRNGSIYSMSVPRGPLGVQLGYARADPNL